jgi:Flp pilus assembly protein TadB
MLTGTALLLLGGGVLGWPVARPRRLARPPTEPRSRRLPLRRGREDQVTESLRSAAALDLLAACLAGGLPVPLALEAVADTTSDATAAAFRSVASHLALGVEPAEAWAPVRERPGLGELAVAAVRTARAGTALAAFAKDLAQRLRASLSADADERRPRPRRKARRRLLS